MRCLIDGLVFWGVLTVAVKFFDSLSTLSLTYIAVGASFIATLIWQSILRHIERATHPQNRGAWRQNTTKPGNKGF